MSRNLKVNVAKYGCCAAFVALAAVAYVASRDFSKAVVMDQYRYLSDAFTIPGVLLIMFGGMVWVSNMGALDGLAFSLRFIAYSLIPGKRAQRSESYGDYVMRKREKQVKGYGFLFISGLISLAISLVFVVLFYSLYE